MFDAIKRANSLDGNAIRDALAATKEFPGVTGNVTFNENRDAVKPIVMIKIQEGGKFVVQERVKVEGAAMPAALSDAPATTTASPAAASLPQVPRLLRIQRRREPEIRAPRAAQY